MTAVASDCIGDFAESGSAGSGSQNGTMQSLSTSMGLTPAGEYSRQPAKSWP